MTSMITKKILFAIKQQEENNDGDSKLHPLLKIRIMYVTYSAAKFALN